MATLNGFLGPKRIKTLSPNPAVLFGEREIAFAFALLKLLIGLLSDVADKGVLICEALHLNKTKVKHVQKVTSKMGRFGSLLKSF